MRAEADADADGAKLRECMIVRYPTILIMMDVFLLDPLLKVIIPLGLRRWTCGLVALLLIVIFQLAACYRDWYPKSTQYPIPEKPKHFSGFG